MFFLAFGRDVDFHDNYPQMTYVDLKTGKILRVYDEDEDAEMDAGIDPQENAWIIEQIEKDQERYLEFAGMDHADHHDILREFIS